MILFTTEFYIEDNCCMDISKTKGLKPLLGIDYKCIQYADTCTLMSTLNHKTWQQDTIALRTGWWKYSMLSTSLDIARRYYCLWALTRNSMKFNLNKLAIIEVKYLLNHWLLNEIKQWKYVYLPSRKHHSSVSLEINNC